MSMPRVVITGLSGGVGKTTVSLGITRAFTRLNLSVHPFKKGPDYIDTAWLALAAKGRASTLDPFFLDGNGLRRHFLTRSAGADLAVIEGNRGFFDGRDLSGSASTAELARQLDAPVVLVVDITKMTRTTAALVAGCKRFPGGERIAGVILNRAGGPRHAAIARNAVEELAQLPVFGVLPRLERAPIFERRAGLVTVGMHQNAEDSLEETADLITANVDIQAILALANGAAPLACAPVPAPGNEGQSTVRIGVVRDDVLWQYYDENLDALRDAGAELVPLSLLDGEAWPEIDALYLGGGDLAPYAAALAANAAGKAGIRGLIASGLPVYAEHAGYFYLGESVTCDGATYPMAGVFPVSSTVIQKPARLGYVEAEITAATPFFPLGFSCKGHEYHYVDLHVAGDAGSLRKTAGSKPIDDPDGLVYRNAFGTSMQIFAPAVPEWAPALVKAAAEWRLQRP